MALSLLLFGALSAAEVSAMTSEGPGNPFAGPRAAAVQHRSTTRIICPTNRLETLVNNSGVECLVRVVDVPNGDDPPHAPTGNVGMTTDSNGGFDRGTCPLVAQTDEESTCTFVYFGRGVDSGTHTVTAQFPGDPNHSRSEGSFQFKIVRPTTTSVVCSGTAVIGRIGECRALVRDPAPIFTFPHGFAEFSAPEALGRFPHSSVCVLEPDLLFPNGTSHCDIDYEPTQFGSGSHKIRVHYNAEFADFHDSSSGEGAIQVLRPVFSQVNCEPGAVPPLGATTCTVTVEDFSDTPETPTGNVQFDSSQPGTFSKPNSTCELEAVDMRHASCSIEFSPAAGTDGSLRITSDYHGDDTHTRDERSTTITVVKDETKTTVKCEPATFLVDHITSCTATVENSSGSSGEPSGFVEFGHSGEGHFEPAGSCELASAGGVVSCKVEYVPTAAGPQIVSATYQGDVSHKSSAGVAAISVDGRQTQGSLVCTPNPVEVHHATHCVATVEDIGGPGATPPSGTVTFHAGSGALDPMSCELQASPDNESASCGVDFSSDAPSDGIPLEAVYGGHGAHKSTTGTTSVTVSERSAADTTISCVPTEVVLGGFTTCTALVTGQPSDGPVTGNVTFRHTGEGEFSNDGVCELTGGSQASCSIRYFPGRDTTGDRELTAVYGGDAVHRGSEGDTTVTAVLNPTRTTLSCAPATVIQNNPTRCTATVTDEGGSPVAPEGIVRFLHSDPGEFSAATCELEKEGSKSSSCHVDYTAEALGLHKLEAIYSSRDAGHESSNPGIFFLSVDRVGGTLDPTTTSIECQAAAVALGEPTSCKVTVEDLARPVSPTGLVELEKIGEGELPGTCELEPISGAGPGFARAACTFTFKPTGFSTANRTIIAAYLGDDMHLFSAEYTEVAIIPPSPFPHDTETQLSCQETSIDLGASTTCTATVLDKATAGKVDPSGEVAFTDADEANTLDPTSCTLAGNGDGTASCQATVTLHPGRVGVHHLHAAYPGDNSHKGAPDATLPVAVNPHSTATTLECEPSNVILGGASACTVTVADTDNGTRSVPKGDVVFTHVGAGEFSNSSTCHLFSIGADEASCQVLYTPSAAGNHELKASYEDDAGHEKSERIANLVVSLPNGGHPTATSLACQPESVFLGGLVICTAEVEDIAPSGRSAPGGDVVLASYGPGTFGDGGCILFPVAAGKARCQLIYRPSEVGAAPHELVALYPGEPGHEPSGPASALVDVSELTGAHDTTTALTCLPANPTVGAPTHCKATVTDADGPSTPDGGVIFATNGPGTFNSGGCHLEQVVAGQASCEVTYTPMAVGSSPHTVSAAYEGDPGQSGPPHEPSDANTDLTVTPPSDPHHKTQTSVACAPASLRLGAGAAAKCTVTVKNAETAPSAPGGTIAIQHDGAASAAVSCVLAGTGTTAACTFTYAPTAAGTHKLTATYQGDAGHLQSTGAAQLQVVGAPAAPNTRITKKPRKKTAARKAKFKFVSDQPGSTFQCKLDKKPFKPCHSPFKKKVRPGRHTFQVRAINPQGMAGAPAVFRWKVG